jgi:hypothetical protein
MKENPNAFPRPPRWGMWLVERLAAPHLREEVEGDLEERFGKHCRRHTPGGARLRFALDLLTLLHPRLWRTKPDPYAYHTTSTLYPDMLSHHLLLTYRTFLRFKGSFLINLVGLSTGLACTLLIFLWVNDELSMDKFHENDKRLYQVMHNLPNGDGSISTIPGTPGMLADALAGEMPELERTTSVVPAEWFPEKGILSHGNVRIKAGGQFVGKGYFQLFTCPLVAGDPNGVFQDKYNVGISDELATQLFDGANNALGKTIAWKQGQFSGTYRITSVFSKPPAHTTAPFDLLLNYALFLDKRPELQDWGNSDPNTFVLLREGADAARLNDKIRNFLQSKTKAADNSLFLQRYSDRYLHGQYENGAVAGGRIAYVRLFSIIAAFILTIACINFMNLSTARASRRTKEVGIKKAIGADRQSIIFQFLGESLLMALGALLVALLLVGLLLPGFNDITGKALSLTFSPDVVLSIFTITLFTGLLAGSYPALYLSGFKPAAVLKGKLRGPAGELWVRRGLVVFQFTLSVILIVSVLVVYQQIAYVQTKNLGYNRDNIMHFTMDTREEADPSYFAEGGTFEKNAETLLNEVKNVPGVIQATNAGGHNLTGQHGGMNGIDWREGPDDEQMDFSNLQVGYDFIELFGIQLTEGRAFSRNQSNERLKVVFNEEAIRLMGLKDPVGKTVRVWGQEKQIIGVAKNFHYESLYEEVKPCIFQFEPRGNIIMLKIAAGRERETIDRLTEFYRKQSPGLPFEYTFVDQDYQALYVAEQRVSVLSRYFAGIAILISCLGLLGLAAFTAERRKKEIGIRKVLGASEAGIVYLLSNDFTRLVGVAIVIALPLSYLLAREWLAGFAYKITLGPWYFLLAGLLALGTALLTVGLQAFKAARTNPVQGLKEE